jgi:hypothetical protein
MVDVLQSSFSSARISGDDKTPDCSVQISGDDKTPKTFCTVYKLVDVPKLPSSIPHRVCIIIGMKELP